MNNIMKKFSPMTPRKSEEDVGGEQSASNEIGGGPEVGEDRSSAKFHQDRALTLMHMRKLFSEFSKSHLSSAEYEQKIYRMLPLLSKVMAMYSPDEVPSQFKEIAQFTGHISKVFVQEVRKRASNQSTEAAAIAIAQFLEPPGLESKAGGNSPDGGSKGWVLMSGLEYLSRTGSLSVMEAACRAALPSTLSKGITHKLDEQFVKHQLLTKLCSQSCAGEELARKDDLSLLFSGASSWCPVHNVSWRKVTAQLLMTISSRILTQTVIKYVHSKACISQFLDNLRESGKEASLSVPERSEMIVCLFCILKDSSSVTPVFLDDLKSANGYQFLTRFILDNEMDERAETQDALRNLLLMFSSVVGAGHHEMKPTHSTSLYTLPGFSVPNPQGDGCSVRNVQAFQVLEQVFIKSRSPSICSIVLDVINSIYSADPANYFILEQQCTLGQFAEKIHTKDKSVQIKFFELLEYVVFHLNHIPAKEFISLCILLKTQSSVECSILCMQSLFRILSCNSVLKNVFRDVGLLEVLVSLLQHYSERVKVGGTVLPRADQTVAFLVLDMLTLLLKNNNANAGVFRECGGTGCVQGLLTVEGPKEWRPGLFQLVQQLLMLPGGDEDLTGLLALLHSTPPQHLEFKTSLLKALLCVLRESHRVRLAFRRVGGYLYLMSVLLSMEGSLADPPSGTWETLAGKDKEDFWMKVLDLFQLIFKVLTISMRFEPANARFFHSEVRYSSLVDSLSLSGGLSERRTFSLDHERDIPDMDQEECREYARLCHRVFELQLEERVFPDDVPPKMVFVCYVLRLLYNMALDNYEKPNTGMKWVNGNHNQTLSPNAMDSIIVHPGAVICILDILPMIKCNDLKWELSVQLYGAEILKSLVRSERNQEVMCDAGLPRRLFSVASDLFRGEDHVLLYSFYYILERLSAQGMQPKELREFLRLDMPLCCRSLDERKSKGGDSSPDKEKTSSTEGGPVPLTRVKALVSMMTPRDFRIAGVSTSPPFVEFDMSVEGFGCIFLPSIGPVALHGTSSVGPGGSDSTQKVSGGVGTGERVFPPLTGLTFMAWIYVEKFSDPKVDSHPIRLLTVSRTVPQRGTEGSRTRRHSSLIEFMGGDSGSLGTPGTPGHTEMVELSCLSIQVSPTDRSLIVATQESDTPGADLERDTGPMDCFARVSVSELTEERQWCHLTVVLNRAVLKQSSVTIYINGRLYCTQKLHYVIQNPGGGATTLAQAAGVHATVGTPPGPMRKQSRLQWRLGSTHLVEEAMSADAVTLACGLGPLYTGSFQTPVLPNGERLPPLAPEERVSFGIHAQATSQMTLSKLRKVYNKADCRAIAKYLGISTHENATPIRILHNSAGHLQGPARTLGGVLIGYLGMRTFCPQPVGKLLESVGGLSCLLGLVAMANDTEGLYASLKALLCAIRNNRNIANDMNTTRGYQTLAVLLKEKSRLLNSHILHLVFSLSGTLDSARETTVIPNQQAFEDLLCDLDVWRQAPPDLQRLLYEHFYELITESGEQKQNLKLIRQTGLLARLLFRLNRDPALLKSSKDVLFNLFAAILQPLPDNGSLLRFGQFVASTMSTTGPVEAEKSCPFDVLDIQAELFSSPDESLDMVLYNVYVRNRCLNILLNVLLHTSGNLNFQLCEQVVRVLGFDWVVALLSPRAHPATVWTGLRILLSLLSHQTLMAKFKEGSGSGGWLSEAESVVQNRAGVVLGFSVSAHGGAVGSACDINPEICHCPGFLSLQHLLPHHSSSADPYLAMLSLLVGQPTKDLHHVDHFSLDSIWSLVFGLPPSHSVAEAIGRVQICPDSVTPLLAMVRRCLQHNVTQGENVWAKTYPQAVLQFLTFLYHNVPEFTTYCSTEEFLTTLLSCLFCDKHSLLEVEEKPEESSGNGTLPPSVSQHESPVLQDHPVRKSVIEFLKSILVDSFHCAAPTKGECVVDILLELMPENSCKKEQMCFVTSLLNSTMDHLLASDVLLCGQSASLPLTAVSSGNNYSMMAANVFYFASRLMDCVWNGLYNGEPHAVFEFLLKLLGQAKRKAGPGVPNDPLVHSLNRSVLYMLSRPVDSIQVQLTVLESLHKVAGARNVIFSSANNDPEFLGCVSHLLFMLSVTPAFMAGVGDENVSAEKQEEEKRLQEGSALVATASLRVWEEMYIVKKQILEDKFRTSLVPEINAARALIGEAANGCWQSFVDGEMRGPSRDLGQIQQQLQSKIQKVASGLQRLASKKALATRAGVSSVASVLTSGAAAATPTYSMANKTVAMPSQTLSLWMRVHLSLIKELVNLQATQYRQWHEHVEKWCLTQWHSVEQELTRERGLWGPCRGSRLNKWILDSTEGPCRMRKKLIPNPSFYLQYPYRPNLELPEHRSLKCKVALSRDSKEFYEKMKEHRPRTMDMRILDTSTTVMTPSEEKTFLFRDMRELNASMIRRVSLVSAKQPTQDDSEEGDENPSSSAADDNDEISSDRIPEEKEPASDSVSVDSGADKDAVSVTSATSQTEKQRQKSQDSGKLKNGGDGVGERLQASKGPDNQTLLRLLEEGEELQSMFRCARIEGLDTSEGLLLFGKDHYYVVDGYTLLKTREIRDLDFLPENLHDPIIPYTATGTVRPRGQKRHCSKFSYEDVREVLKRRYLLQPIALEVFSADGRNYLLAFPKKTRNKVYAKFLSVSKSMTDSGAQSISGQRSSMSLEQSGGSSLLSSLVGETSVTQRWVRGEISNFQYLIHLNTLAGRSYNDLSQYPVFPWVLTDYDSEELDLTDPGKFRDLGKPMGAQTGDRLEQFMKRYREWDDPSGEIPPYMYGTHYSSAMIVVSYLVRTEPFTQQFLKLQGGHFDLADRMFHSIKDGWLSASKNNMADVKELIPEFFYLPEFLLNANRYDLGVKQSGVPLDDVLLPPWAKGDAREFIRIHREALESDFVSAHLHEWIDLIFGWKQQGQSAIEAYNLFHHLFYEGNVDIEAIEDPLTRNATIGFINNFGQIPSQLFKKQHPAKKLAPSSIVGKSTVSGLTPLSDPSLSTPGVTTERCFFHALDCLKPPNQAFKELRGPVGQIFSGERGALCAVEQNKVLLPPLFTKYLAWGFADRSIRLGNYDTDRSVCIHELADSGDIVCAACPNSRVLVTGSTNTVVTVWELVGASHRMSPTNCVLKVRKALYGHTEPVSCIATSGAYGIVVSGSRDGSCIVWDLSKYSFIRQLGPHPGPVSAVAINEITGDIGSSAGTYLYLWSINGDLLALVNTAASPKADTKQLIFAISFSTVNEWDSQHVVMTGSSDGIVKMWSLDYVQLLPEVEVGEAESGSRKVETPQSAPPMLGSQGFRDSFNAELLNQRLLLQQQNSSFGSSLDTPMDTPRLWSLNGSPEIVSPLPPDSGFATPVYHRSFSYNEVSAGNLPRQGSTDSFVFVNREGVAMVKTSNKLKPGFRWNRQLIFRSKLTLHTALERKDNPHPAAITAIAPSKDHKTLYVGDSRGRIWSWVVGEGSGGGRADHWAQDFSRSSCVQCHQRFTLAERKHHCRNCGQIFCARCSRFESDIRHMKITKPVRVCQNCFVRLRAESNETKRD